ncbi:MAG: hypothetical protein KGH64_02605 [Candidatus Micrarchaeota archaeon]|nr:hypothetical protein [Candidatus Micrarchaeota archaeon]MDE1834203.1 hypothetical protein [Candidatus Micrarchaeota archaeon]
MRKLDREQRRFSRSLRGLPDRGLIDAALRAEDVHNGRLVLKEVIRRSEADYSWKLDEESRHQFLDYLKKFIAENISDGSISKYAIPEVFNSVYSLDIRPGELAQYKHLIMRAVEVDISENYRLGRRGLLEELSHPDMPSELIEGAVSYLRSGYPSLNRKNESVVIRQLEQFGRLTGDDGTYMYETHLDYYIRDTLGLAYGTPESKLMKAFDITSQEIRSFAFNIIERAIEECHEHGYDRDEISEIRSIFKLSNVEMKPYILKYLNAAPVMHLELYKEQFALSIAELRQIALSYLHKYKDQGYLLSRIYDHMDELGLTETNFVDLGVKNVIDSYKQQHALDAIDHSITPSNKPVWGPDNPSYPYDYNGFSRGSPTGSI